MKKTILLIIIVLAFGCRLHSSKEKSALTDKERHYCDSLQIDTSIISLLRQYTSSTVDPFHYSRSRELLSDGTEKELEPVYLQGLVFKETAQNTEIILEELSKSFKDKGYLLFILDRNFDISNKPDVMGILKMTDKYQVLTSIKTNGTNYDIDTDSLVNIIKFFDNKYSLDLIGAGGDWCEFKINKEPTDWLALAQEAYKFCPDIVDQGAGTVDALAEEMKKNKRLYFWWD